MADDHAGLVHRLSEKTDHTAVVQNRTVSSRQLKIMQQYEMVHQTFGEKSASIGYPPDLRSVSPLCGVQRTVFLVVSS